ncbi:MAG: hypothetical protein ACR2JE_17405 [Acidobacteriaceae bacterium]
MTNRVLIATNSGAGNLVGPTAAERNEITLHLQRKGWQVWHWFEDLWLVTYPGEEMRLPLLRDELRALLGAKYVLIMSLNDSPFYSGFGPQAAWPWMTENWGKPL